MTFVPRTAAGVKVFCGLQDIREIWPHRSEHSLTGIASACKDVHMSCRGLPGSGRGRPAGTRCPRGGTCARRRFCKAHADYAMHRNLCQNDT